MIPGLKISHEDLCVIPVVFILAVFAAGKAGAAFEDRFTSSRGLGMGGISAALMGSDAPLSGNVALMAGYGVTRLDGIYSRPFGMSELALRGFSLTFPGGKGTIGLGATKFGFSLYSENSLTGAYARRFGDRLSAGFGVRYMALSISGYGTTDAVGLDFGMSLLLGESVNVGFGLRNSGTLGLNREGVELPASYTGGVSWRLSESMLLCADVRKEGAFSSSVRIGAEFVPVRNMAVRFGVSDNPSRFAGGLGFRAGRTEINYAVMTHQQLGLTHQVSFGFLL